MLLLPFNHSLIFIRMIKTRYWARKYPTQLSMNNFLIKLYSSIKNKNSFLSKIKFYGAQRFLIRFIANNLIPFFFNISNYTNQNKSRLTQSKGKGIIISLTSFPARINTIWIVIECMMRQTLKPDRIILWLSQEQFSTIEKLPNKLLDLQERGLEIVLCPEDIKSHKKYYYVLKRFPESTFITVDDDFIYPFNLIEELVKKSNRHPNTICCHRAMIIKTDSNKILPYNDWDLIYGGSDPSFDIFFTSGAGTLFPPNSLYKDVIDKKTFMKHCKFADDVWLNAMSQLQNTQIVKVSSKHSMHIPLIVRNNITLTSVNVRDSQNDIQIDNIRNHFLSKINVDIFANVFQTNN